MGLAGRPARTRRRSASYAAAAEEADPDEARHGAILRAPGALYHREDGLERGLELTEPGGELAVLPTYTAMLRLRAIATQRGLTRPYWEA